MAKRDVDLVVRAKDEATKVVEAITGAINDFVEAQADLSQSAGKTDSSLGKLGAALGKLDKELKGFDASAKVAESFDKARVASDRLNADFKKTQKTAADLARDLDRATAATERLSNKAQGAAAAQERQQAALSRAKKAQAGLTQELTKATRERDKAIKSEERLANAILKQQERVAQASERYRKLSAEIANTANPTKTLQNRLESANRSLDTQGQKLEKLIGGYDRAQKETSKLGQTIGTLGTKIEKANQTVARQSTVVGKIATNYKNLEAAAKSSARHQTDLQNAADKTANALGRQSQNIERAEKELVQLATAAGKADAAMSQLATRSGEALNRSFGQQRRAMLEAKREYATLTQEATRLASEIGRVGVPTRAMAEAFDRSVVGARKAKTEYIELRNSLQQMRGAMAQSGTSLDALRAKQAAFTQIQQATSASMARASQVAAASSGRYGTLAAAAGRAAASQQRAGQQARSASSGMRTLASETDRAVGAYNRLYGASRQAMSFTQRLRGEVLALVSAYAGIYGVVNLLGRTVNAYQTLEAATSRLNVAFNGDVQKAGVELDFVRRNADRLGIEFGSLAQEYSKFAIATQGTVLAGENTRKIFISVAEAARVNKASFDEMRGIFVALTQIVSKGAVQMEELRQQLGDRLPGALRIMADGLGVSTAQLVKMMEQGEITAEALVPFAEELDKRFGPGLADALKTTTTALGRFKNAAFQALVQFGNAGFIESFTELINTLTETLRDADFQTFAGNISKAFALLTDAITLAIKNFDTLVIAASAFAGIKMTPVILALANNFQVLGQRVSRVGTIMAATSNTMRATAATSTGVAASMGRVSIAVRGLTLAFRVLLSSTGIGLAITAISVAIGYWATRADEATEALAAHQKLVDRVKNAYEEAGKAAGDWADEIARGSITQAQANLASLQDSLRSIRDEAKAPVDAFGTDTRGTVQQLQEAVDAFKDGTLSAEDFKKAVDDIAQADPKLDRGIALSLLETADNAAEAEKRVAEAEAVIKLLNGTATEADKAVLGLSKAADDAAHAQRSAAEGTAKFNEEMKKLAEVIPEINGGLDIMKDKAKLDEIFKSAAEAAQNMQQLDSAVKQYNESLNKLYESGAGDLLGGQTDGLEASAELLRNREGFRSTPYWDVNAFRVGFGSDTVTLADGSIKKVVQGMRISVADANRDLYRRIGEFQNTIRGQIGGERFAQFNAQQQAALTSIAYNYGELPDRIIEAVRTGSDQQIAEAIRSLAGDNGGVNAERRRVEAGLFTTQAGVGPQSKEFTRQQEEAAKERERAAEDAAKEAERTQERLSANEQAISQQQLINDGKAREAEIERAIAEAKKENPNITDEELAKLREQTGLLYDLKNVRTEDKNVQKEAAAASAQVNALLQQRNALEQQLKIVKGEGDNTKVQETEQAIAAVNAQLDAAIAKARAMWESIGGAAADTAIVKLDTAAIKAGNLAQKGTETEFNWASVGDLFANGLVGAFNDFAQAVAAGEDVGEAARKAFLKFAANFLIQIGQMIIKQAIFNALRGLSGGGGFFGSLFGGLGAGTGHTGGLVGSKRVGSGNSVRHVSPAVFANARRMHTGGIVGLKPNEVPIIGKKGEEMLTQDDPRHMLNGGGKGQGGGGGNPQERFKIVNAFDSAGMLEEAMTTETGEKAVLNFVRRNSSAFKAAIGG